MLKSELIKILRDFQRDETTRTKQETLEILQEVMEELDMLMSALECDMDEGDNL